MPANVEISDTFDQWRVKNNELFVMTQSVGSAEFIKLTNTTNSTSNTTGSITTAGGLGVAASAVIGGNINVHGNIHANGTISADGSITLGDADTDNIVFNADVNSDIIPNTDMSFDIGNTTFGWANTFTGHISVEQASDAGKPAITVTSADTDQIGISVTASQIDADVLDIAADGVTTAKVIDVTADALTTGSVLYIDSDSSTTDTRSIATIIQNHTSATGATGLTVQADAGRGLFIDSNLAAGGYSLEIDAENTTTNVAYIAASTLTTGTALHIVGAATTTGALLDLDDTSTETDTRNVAKIAVNADAATGATVLALQADAGRGLFIDSNLAAGGPSIEIDSEHTTTNTVIINSDPTTTATIIDISADSLTTGGVLKIDSDSSDTGTRSIATIIQNHASAVAATAFTVQSDGGRGVFIDSNLAAGLPSLEIDSEHTTTNVAKIASIATSGTLLELSAAGVLTGDVINITADSATTGKGINVSMDALTTGSMLYLDDASASTSTRNSAQIIQNHDSAIAATALLVQSDSGVTGMLLDKNFPAAAVAGATIRGLWVDFDHTVPGSGTAAQHDIGIDLDLNSATLGTSTSTGLDIDVVGATSGTHTAIGLDVTVGSADTNIAARFTGGEVAMLTTTKLSFHDVGGGENMSATSDGALTINSGTTLTITTPLTTIADGSNDFDIASHDGTNGLKLGGTVVTATAAVLNAVKNYGKESIWVPANSMTPTSSNPCADITAVETTSGRPDMYVLDFDKDADEFAQFAIAFPKSWNLGTVTFQAFWSGIAATSDVDWGLQGVAMNDNETIDVAYGTAVVVTDNAQGAVEELLVSAESGAITIAGTPADNDLCYFRIYRDVSGDAMAGDARLHGVKIFFTTDAANDA